MNPEIRTVPVTPFCGLEISGMNLAEPLTPQEITFLNDAFHTYGLLKFTSQDFSESELFRLSQYFGALGQTDGNILNEHKYRDGDAQLLYMDLKNMPSMKTVTKVWHADYSFRSTKVINAIVLHAKASPIHGGQTLFCDMRSVYDALSPGMKQYVDNQYTVHDSTAVRRPYLQLGIISEAEYLQSSTMERSKWPLVCKMPTTGRKYLYINPRHTDHIVDTAPDESATILNYLFRNAVDLDYVYAHTWAKGDVIVFSNLCFMHRGVHQYEGDRVIWKVDAYGPPPAIVKAA